MTATPAPVIDDAEEKAAQEEIRKLARKVKNQKQFRKIIADADPAMREAVYEMIKPHLRFVPLSFLLTKPR